MKKVLIIGSRGMLATSLARILSASKDLDTYVVGRNFSDYVDPAKSKIFRINEDVPEFFGFDYIINAAGVIKPYIKENDMLSIYNAIYVNSIFPHKLRAMNRGIPIIQIATDCVFSGAEGYYNEAAAHDALDIYGKTKSLGEVVDEDFVNLRCSIIGVEPFNKKSLLAWFLGQLKGSTLNGFANHFWNGITTDAFAKICLTIIKHDIKVPRLMHLIPVDKVDKYELLNLFQQKFQTDYNIVRADASTAVNRVLKSEYDSRTLWQASGYESIPTVRQLVNEL